jgi:hypothetical protein
MRIRAMASFRQKESRNEIPIPLSSKSIQRIRCELGVVEEVSNTVPHKLPTKAPFG